MASNGIVTYKKHLSNNKCENFEKQMYQDCNLSNLLRSLLSEPPNSISHGNNRKIANNYQYNAKNIKNLNNKYEKTDISTLKTFKSLNVDKCSHLTSSKKKEDAIQVLPRDRCDNKKVKSLKCRKNTYLLKSQTALKEQHFIKKLNLPDNTHKQLLKHTSLGSSSAIMSHKSTPGPIKSLATKQLSIQNWHNLNARDDLILSTADKLNDNTSLTNLKEGMKNQLHMSSSNSSNNHSYDNRRPVPAKSFQKNLENICLDSVTQEMIQIGFKNEINLKYSAQNVKSSISTTEMDNNILSQYSNGNKVESQRIECVIDLVENSDNETDTQGNNLSLNAAGMKTNTPRTNTHNVVKHLLESKSTATPDCSKSDDGTLTNLNNAMSVQINKNAHSEKKKVNVEKPNEKLLQSNGFIIEHVMCSSGFAIKYVCVICNKRFLLKCRVIRHLSVVHCELRNHLCLKCGKAFKTVSCLKIHIDIVHSSNKQVKCSYCNKIYRHSISLKSHIYKNHTTSGRKKPITCDLCQKTLSSSKCLSRHMKTQHKMNDEQYICNECSAVFNEKSSLTIHIKSKHLPPEYKCLKCSSMFHTVGKLNHHLYKQHMIQKKNSSFVCEMCGKVSRSKESLNNHILTHYNEKQFSCDKCGKCFRTSSNLSQHSVVHKNKRPYACYLCDKAFRIRNHLKQHMSVHGMVSTSASKKRKRSNCETK